MIQKLDGALMNYARLTKEIFPDADENYPGSGAAGGLGFALHTYLHAELKSGIDLVMDTMGIREAISESDLVITGEGRLDAQSAMGKAPIGIAREAKKHGKTVIAFSGCVSPGAEKCNEAGIDAFFPILRAPVSLSEAMDVENAYNNLRDTSRQVFRLIKSTSEGN
jgi:glycerate kinase